MTEEAITQMSEREYKTLVKKSVRNAAFSELEEQKVNHTKVKDNRYDNLERPQQYITCKSFTNTEVSILFGLRSRTIRGIKENFKTMYKENTLCPICERSPDTQEHVTQCKVLLGIQPLNIHINHDHIRGSVDEQAQFVKTYKPYLKLRDELLKDSEESSSLPVLYTGPLRPQAWTSQAQARRCGRAEASR